MQVQELNEQVGRAFVFPITETRDPSEMLEIIAKSEENCRLFSQETERLAGDVSVKTEAAIDAATRAEAAANNAEVRSQSLYQDRVVLETPAITLQEKVCRYERAVAVGDDFTIDVSGLNQQKDITFELILKMPTAVSFSLGQILPLGADETADNNKKWMGGGAPDLSEAGEHWIAFTSHDGGQTWRASYEGLFLI